MNKERMITVGELKKHLSLYKDDCEITFSGLNFYRTKTRGEKLVQIEFDETIHRNNEGIVEIANHQQ
jgi:hypothetical protein